MRRFLRHQSPVNPVLRRPVITGGQLRMTSQISPIALPYIRFEVVLAREPERGRSERSRHRGYRVRSRSVFAVSSAGFAGGQKPRQQSHNFRSTASPWRFAILAQKRPSRAFALATSTGRPSGHDLSVARRRQRNGKSGRFRRAKRPLHLRSSGKPKAEVVVPVVRRVPVAVRRAAVPGIVVPAAAPVHPVRGP